MDTEKDFAIELLKAELDVIELDERLEMVSLGAVGADAAAPVGSNGVCCCS